METHRVTQPSERLKCPNSSVSKLKVDPHEKDCAETILCYEDEKDVKIHLKCNGEEGSSDDKFIESAAIARVNETEELDQIKSELCLGESSYKKWETRTFEKIKIEPSERNIKDLDYDVSSSVKKETDDVNEIEVEVLDYCHEISNKSVIIKQEEIHIKDEQDVKDNLSKKIPKSREQTVLHQCPECFYKTTNKYYFKRHSIKHKKLDKSDSFKCSKCSYQSKTKSQLTVHRVKHESMDKWHSCPLCPFKAYSRAVLIAHCRRRHSIDPSNPKQIEIYKCRECTYESGYKRDFKIHQLLHDQNNWFQCSYCAYRTAYKNILQKHQVRHQGENAEGWQRCPECSYKTSDKHNLRKHVILHKSADEAGWIECSQCSFRTAYKKNLTRHQLKHKEAQEIDWFYCNECRYKAKRKSYLVTHVLSKHKKRIDKFI